MIGARQACTGSRYAGAEMASQVQPLSAGGEPSAARSDTTVAPSAKAGFSDTVTVSDPFNEEVGGVPSDVIDGAALESELDAMGGGRRYASGEILGSGGMGEVRLSLDQRIGRRVARKTMHAKDSAVALRRFLREARVQGQLEHPAIVPVYDLDVDEDEQVYFTMKRVRGETLERILEHLRKGDVAWTRRFGTRRILSAFAQVCLAVDYAHTRRVVHRDLKPSNIMLGSYGEVYLLDWGLAKVSGVTDPPVVEEEDAVDGNAVTQAASVVVGASGMLTAKGALLGTIGYMAPEQLAGRGARIDARADVYALGAILFEILTLTRFRTETNARELLFSLASNAIERPSTRAPSVPPELDELCVQALAVRPEDRPPSARALAEAVERYLDGEHDLKLRKDLAARHAAAARKRLEDAGPGGAEGRVEAMREAMKALALDVDQPEAQGLLLDLLTNASDEVPAAARSDLDAAADRSRKMNAALAMRGLFLWLAVVPIVVLAGVMSWTTVGTTAALTLITALFARRLAQKTRFGTAEALLLTGMTAAIIALTSCYLGAFVLSPTAAAIAAMILAISATKRERWVGALLFVAGALAPFIAESAGLGPPAYTFEPGKIIVSARAIGLPRWPTIGAMAYATVAWILIPVVLVGRMRDALHASERRQFVQAWYLRQLFWAGGGEPRG
ncbi:Serine/threonine protein kinase PrkC, regulator of stationary phase [Minicystis rosea]|nr:Serine/threonine protein kinase PrkC, regulator of stationary phase [Minicystis rosea]